MLIIVYLPVLRENSMMQEVNKPFEKFLGESQVNTFENNNKSSIS